MSFQKLIYYRLKSVRKIILRQIRLYIGMGLLRCSKIWSIILERDEKYQIPVRGVIIQSNPNHTLIRKSFQNELLIKIDRRSINLFQREIHKHIQKRNIINKLINTLRKLKIYQQVNYSELIHHQKGNITQVFEIANCVEIIKKYILILLVNKNQSQIQQEQQLKVSILNIRELTGRHQRIKKTQSKMQFQNDSKELKFQKAQNWQNEPKRNDSRLFEALYYHFQFKIFFNLFQIHLSFIFSLIFNFFLQIYGFYSQQYSHVSQYGYILFISIYDENKINIIMESKQKFGSDYCLFHKHKNSKKTLDFIRSKITLNQPSDMHNFKVPQFELSPTEIKQLQNNDETGKRNAKNDLFNHKQQSALFDLRKSSNLNLLRFPKIYQNGKELLIYASRSQDKSISKQGSLTLQTNIQSPMKGIKQTQYRKQKFQGTLGSAIKTKLENNLKLIQPLDLDRNLNLFANYNYIPRSKESKIKLKQKKFNENCSSSTNNLQQQTRMERNLLLLKTLEIYTSKKLDQQQSYSKSKVITQLSINDNINNSEIDSNNPEGNQLEETVQKKIVESPLIPTIILKSKRSNWRDLKFEFQTLQYNQFIKLMRSYNYFDVKERKQGVYKAYVGNGNNSQLIKKCLKARGYWIIVDEVEDDVNFVWTQTKHKRFFEKIENSEIQSSPQIISNEWKNKQEKSALLKDFIAYKKKSYTFLEGVQNMLNQSNFEQYLNYLIKIYLKNPKKSSHFYKLSEFLQAHRKKIPKLQLQNAHSIKLHNHVQLASSIGNKKGLFFHMKSYYEQQKKNPFEVVPQTIHLKNIKCNSSAELKNMIDFELPCILKPGELTNRGKGITVHTTWSSLYQTIQSSQNQKHNNNTEQKTFIIQKYIVPFLYNNRKFDIRVWVLRNGKQAWWYKEGYLRTSSKQFNIKSVNKYVHLTNDAIQKCSEDYGKYEPSNKISFNQFQKYLEYSNSKHNFWESIYPSMKKIAKDVFRVANFTMDKNNKKFCYELFGLDFMIDENFKVWLIEANTNPCLETNCSLLNRLITNMIQNTIQIAVDPLFPPPNPPKKKPNFSLQNFRFQLLYDGYQQQISTLLSGETKKFDTQQDEFQEKVETPQQFLIKIQQN